MARYKTCLAQECCCGIRPIASVLRRTAHPELLTSRRRIPRATTKMRPLRLQMWLKFNILERKKKTQKNYLHCVLYKIYIYDPLSYLIFFICVLDPIWYPLITKSFEWMTSFRNWQEDLPYSQASACTNSDVVRVSVSRLVHWHR